MALCKAVLNGITRACASNIGGVSKFWIADLSDVQASISVNENKEVTAIDTVNGNHWKEYQVRSETSTATWAGVEGIGGVIAYYNYTITVLIDRQDATKNREIEQLAAAPLALIFEDNNGIKWLVGEERGVLLRPATAGDFGTSFTDSNQYSLSFESPMSHLAYMVTATIPAPTVDDDDEG